MFLSRILCGRYMRFKDHTDPLFGHRLDLGTDSYWKRRKVFMLTSHFRGRRRNCFTVAVRGLIKAMEYVADARKLRMKNFKALSDSRISGSSGELGYDAWHMRETLSRLNIGLDRKVIANLAVYEPRTYSSLVGLCAHKEAQPKAIGGMDRSPPRGPPLEVSDPYQRL
uniref:39S ribosomal protein L20, mitochondrial n=1 Tax=Caligus rogercresseyi TaxID=217165 RepID=C1BQC7_CALRO|nr:39S ribosomal protein L20, mitochondrial precursor [Caligus rogercresseyi]